MQRHRATLAASFGSLIILAVTISFFLQQPQSATGQIVHPADDSATGFTVAPNTHVFFSCKDNGPLLTSALTENTTQGFWLYEFTGNEPPLNGKYFISSAVLTAMNIDSDKSTLQQISAGQRYYVYSGVPLSFRCNEGFRALPTCGNGIVEAGEVCDTVSGCTNTCTAESGFRCDPTENDCSVLIPSLDKSSQSSDSFDSFDSFESSLPVQSPEAEAGASSTSSSHVSSLSSQSSQSSSASSIPSNPNPSPNPSPIVEFDTFEMKYISVPKSNALKAGKEISFGLRIRNKANAPRTFQFVHYTNAIDNIAPDLRNQDNVCETKNLPYFGRWRTFCRYVLQPGEERDVEYAFTVKEDISCGSKILANVELFTKAASYDKRYNRFAVIFPDGCDAAFGATSNISCPTLATIQGDPDYISISSPDKTLVVYKYFGDNNGVTRSLGSIVPATCTERDIVRPQDIPVTMRIGEMYLSHAKDILYELSEWYTSSGKMKRSLHLVNGTTGIDTAIVPNAPTNTGVNSMNISDDGKTVAFVASGVDIDNDPNTSYSNTDKSAELFVWRDGVITQLTSCTPSTNGTSDTCNAIEPRFVGATAGKNRHIQVKLNYNPITKQLHDENRSYRFYLYDAEEKSLVGS